MSSSNPMDAASTQRFLSTGTTRTATSRGTTPGLTPQRMMLRLVAISAIVTLGAGGCSPKLPATTVGGSIGLSSQAVPVGDLPGWHQVFIEDFRTAVPVGQFPGSVYGRTWNTYPDGTPDTWKIGEECPSKVLSVHDGTLDYFLHEANCHPADPHPRGLVAAATPKITGQTYGRYSVRLRAQAGVRDYALAILLWPDSNNWPADGEIDFAEGRLNGQISANAHHADPQCPKGDGHCGTDHFSSAQSFGSWHTATVDWLPGREVFYLDDREFGATTTLVPHNPMHLVLQVDTGYGSTPTPGESAHVQVAWVAVYTRA
jgi:hypothetical protein